MRIKKNDMVKVISGKEKGKTGRVLRVFPDRGTLVIEQVNFVRKHQRPTQDNPQGGILEIEGPLRAEKTMVICKNCNQPTRVGKRYLADGSKVRYCKKCKEDLPEEGRE